MSIDWYDRCQTCEAELMLAKADKAELLAENEKLRAKAQEFYEAWCKTRAAITKAESKCQTCKGNGYLVADAEWEPYAVQCPDCTPSSLR